MASISDDRPAFSTGILRFQPLYHERVWGGRELSRRFGRELPDGGPIGESWEVVDRPEAQSIVCGGPWDGTSLHTLWQDHRDEVFGLSAPKTPDFPLLVKILDARDTLSLQVHPPDSCAAELGGEPKTEMWVVVDAEPGAALYCGVKEGVGREDFAAALAAGTAADCVPRLPVRSGDAIFIPSGRLHAIGAGLVIFEIQQNSDTTYRVFDWNRVGLDGKPRPLHVEESLRCIDFTDTTPELTPPDAPVLASCEHFEVRRHRVVAGQSVSWGHAGDFSIVAVVSGEVVFAGEALKPGDFAMVPAALSEDARRLSAMSDAELLETTFGRR
jgi:mannose-6-phosphate isomerase